MTCNDCIHYEVCRDRIAQLNDKCSKWNFEDESIEKCEVGLGFQDRNKFIEIKHAHWIRPTILPDGYVVPVPHCSNCEGFPCGVNIKTKYCPECGAKMDEAIK